MIFTANRNGARWLAMLAIAMTLGACSSNHSDLQAEIDRLKARPGAPIPPLPEVRPAPSYVYAADDRRSPFIPDAPQRMLSADANSGIGPDPNRPREQLELEPLDSLTMVGTLRNVRGNFGLIQDREGLVHRVTVGNYLGQNHGRITGISESEIQLEEIVSDGLGGFINRPASIGIQ